MKTKRRVIKKRRSRHRKSLEAISKAIKRSEGYVDSYKPIHYEMNRLHDKHTKSRKVTRRKRNK